VNNEYIEESINKFRNSRDALYALVAEQERLDSGVRKSIARYIDDFYEIIDDPQEVERKIIDRCL
jgi:hypothetical protein